MQSCTHNIDIDIDSHTLKATSAKTALHNLHFRFLRGGKRERKKSTEKVSSFIVESRARNRDGEENLLLQICSMKYNVV